MSCVLRYFLCVKSFMAAIFYAAIKLNSIIDEHTLSLSLSLFFIFLHLFHSLNQTHSSLSHELVASKRLPQRHLLLLASLTATITTATLTSTTNALEEEQTER